MPEATFASDKEGATSFFQRFSLITRRVGLLILPLGVVFVSGCATTLHEIATFDPVPPENVGHATELEPVEPGTDAEHGGGHTYSPLVVPDPLPPQVCAELDELQSEYPSVFQRGLDRASKYEAMLRAEFRRAGLPEDLIWMAMVESMFQTKVVSPAGAGGMWQFMPATARRYQLRLDGYVDERYSWEGGTRAAIQYLKDLHDFFDGSWELAITAYNMGEGGLSRIITATGGERSFWKLIETPPASVRMKQESKKYYPRLLAYMIVTADPEKYGFTRGSQPPDDTVRVPVDGVYSLAKLDEALGFAAGTLATLNPELIRGVTPPKGAFALAVPRADQERFLVALKSVSPLKNTPSPLFLASGGSGKHRVRRGETISKIAGKYGVSEKELMKANKIKSARSLRVNQTLVIPGVDVDDTQPRGGGPETATPAPAEREKTEPVKGEAAPVFYTVKKGDTLAGIAARHKATVDQLKKWNNIGKNGVIYSEQKLVVAMGRAPVSAPAPVEAEAKYHVVKAGEYPAIIAEMHNMPVKKLLAMNNLGPKDMLHAGDRLIVAGAAAEKPAPKEDGEAESAAAGAEEAPAAELTISHKVARGETAGAIADKHGVPLKDLLAWNKLTAKSVIKSGQELIIKKQSPAGEGAGDKKPVRMASAAAPDAGEKIVHKVAAGQNPTSIAKKYGVPLDDLFAWNKWSKTPLLKVGDAVTVYKPAK